MNSDHLGSGLTSESWKEFWLEKLAGGPGASSIISDYERPQSYSDERRAVEIRLGGELSRMIEALSGESLFLAYTVLQAALKICLYKYTSSRVVTVGSPPLRDNGASKRRATVLPIKDQIDDRSSFKEFLLVVRETLLEAYAKPKIPLIRLMKDLGLPGSQGRCPLFDIILALDELHTDLPELNNDMTITFTKTAGEMFGKVDYLGGLFSEARIKRFVDDFTLILRDGLDNRDKPLYRFDLLTEDERHRILIDWNNTETDYARNEFFHHLFETQAELEPDQTALAFEKERISYGDLNARANQLAHHLRGLGVGPETVVGVGMERSVEMVVGLLGVLKAGGSYLPLDLSYPEERLAFLLADAEVAVVLTSERSRCNLPADGPEVVCLDAGWEIICRESKENPALRLSPENIAYVIYTSGSTGKPKGVLIPHRGLTNYLNWAKRAYPVADGNGSAVHSPLTFDLTITSLFLPLLAGKTVTLLPEDRAMDALSEALSGHNCFSLIKITPAHMNALSQYLDGSQIADFAKAMIIGGEAIHGESLGFWQACSPETRFVNEYGPTETVVGCCTYEVPRGVSLSGAVPIGRPIAQTQIYLLDSHLQPVSVGAPGELCVAGDGLARGYIKAPDLTALKFIPNPFSKEPGQRLYRTGDLARYLPDGNLVFLGRYDNQVKIRGYRIELGEIEEVLGQHHAVQDRAAVVCEDGAGEKHLIAFVVTELPESSVADTLSSFLAEKLPKYMIPSLFVQVAALPLTRNGKVDRDALPLPDQFKPHARTPFVAPRTETELALADIWSQVLKIEKIGINDNFFSIGGSSLTAVQVTARVRKAFDLELRLRAIFDSPTIAKLSEAIEEAKGNSMASQSPALLPVSRELYRRK